MIRLSKEQLAQERETRRRESEGGSTLRRLFEKHERRWADVCPTNTDPTRACRNCDDRKCMGCVFREWDHDCVDDCPDCCD